MSARKPEIEDQVELVLAGHASAADRDAVERSGTARLVRFTGYLPHEESVMLLRSADLLFLPMHKLPPGERARIVPGKTYEYLAARRPILAAVPEGDARDFVLASRLGWVCEPDDCDGMARIVEERFEAFRNHDSERLGDEAFLARFDRAALAKQLASVLDAAIAGELPRTV